MIGQPRSTQRYVPIIKNDQEALQSEIIRLATQYGRYSYRRITELLRNAGWLVNHKRVERIWRQEGLKVSQRQPKRGRLWVNDDSCVRLRPAYRNHVWSYDFVSDRTHGGRAIKMLTVIDDFSRQCLAIVVDRHIKSDDVLYCLADLFLIHGIPDHIRSDNGPEFTVKAVRQWLKCIGVETLYIEPGSPWENGYNESFDGKLRDEVLNRKVFYTLKEAGQIVIGRWREEYNTIRPHSSLNYQPPEAVLPLAINPNGRLVPQTNFPQTLT